jgi:hypothetical protein
LETVATTHEGGAKLAYFAVKSAATFQEFFTENNNLHNYYKIRLITDAEFLRKCWQKQLKRHNLLGLFVENVYFKLQSSYLCVYCALTGKFYYYIFVKTLWLELDVQEGGSA